MAYGTGQKIAFGGLLIGFLLCTAGAIAPYWQQGQISISDLAAIFRESIPFFGSLTMVKMYGGLWWYCIEVLGERKCETYDFSDDHASYNWAIRIACVVNVLLTLICALAALCRTCCCAGGKTICHGMMAFIAGAAGIAAVGIFAGTASDGFAVKLMMGDYGWAFYMYAVGSAVVTLVSIMLCFASPDNPITPVIISSVNQLLPNGRYTRMTDERILIEERERNA